MRFRQKRATREREREREGNPKVTISFQPRPPFPPIFLLPSSSSFKLKRTSWHTKKLEAKNWTKNCSRVLPPTFLISFFLSLVPTCPCGLIGRFIALWATFWSLWQQLFSPKRPHFLAIFVKVSKSFISLVKSFLGNFYRRLATFYWSHCHLQTLARQWLTHT